jgi:hypothetical protein
MSVEKLRMPKGRLRLGDNLDGPVVGLWEWKTTPNTTMAALERSYLEAIDAAPKVSARKAELTASGKYTDAGVIEQLIPAAVDEARRLRRGQNAAARAKAELVKRRNGMRLKEPDRTNPAAAIERMEIRSWLRSLSQDERDRLFLGGGERVDPAVIEAVISAPPELSGVAASHLKLMRERLLEAQFPDVAGELADLEKAIDVTERAVDASAAEILKEVGVTREKFDQLAEAAMREVDAADASAMKSQTPESKIDADAIAEQIRALPYSERSKFIDLAIDTNALS